MRIRPSHTVLYLRPDTRNTAPAFILGESEGRCLLYVLGRSELRPAFIAIGQDYNEDGIYEDVNVNWFYVTPEQTKEIAEILNWVGYQLE